METRGKICLHITKTAGGTLKQALDNASGLEVAHIYNDYDKDRLKAADLASIDLLYGHAIFGIDTEINYGTNPRYFCFFRHPVSRTVSHYYHLRSVEEGPIGDKIRQSSDINDFFENYEHWEFGNFMSRIVSGLGDIDGVSERDLLQKATENLVARFDFVGFQEYFSLSIRGLSKYLCASLDVEEDVNVGRYNFSGVSDRTIQAIHEGTKVDMALYKFAIDRFL